MPTDAGSQALCGPFSSTDFPDYQAAIQHVNVHWRRFLSMTQLEIVQAIVDRTARFGKQRSRRIPMEWFFDGHDGNPEKGYAGCAPIAPCTPKSFREARAELERLGIIVRDDETYTIDYSVNAMHLATDEGVQKRVLSANKRGGALSTVQGIVEWAAKLVAQWCERYTVRSSKTHVFEDKSSNNAGVYFLHKVRDFFMGRTNKDALLASIMGTVEAGRAKIAEKRKTRRSLSDLCNLFEEGWRSGQKERNPKIMPARLVSRDRALLKTQIIGPARDADIDPQAFANWIALNWDGIGATYFQKAKSYPEHPSFAWLVRCLETYTGAYHARDGIDLSGLANPSQRVSTKAVKDIADQADKAVNIAADRVADLQAQLREAREDNERLRAAKALPIDDDPVYARASKLAARKITIGKYDDETPVRRKLARHRK